MPHPFDEPVMSDRTILISVEDLISIAMGPQEKNTVNFKLVQSILHILARQMRLLETNVELRINEFAAETAELKKKKKKKRDASSSSLSADEDAAPRKKRDKKEKDKERKEKDSESKEEAEEREKLDKMSPKERKAEEKRREQAELEKILEGMSPAEQELYLKQREKEEELLKGMSSKEKEKYLKNREKERKFLNELSPKERARYLKNKQKEEQLLQSMSPKEKEKYLKEKEKEEKILKNMSPKERAQYFRDKEKDELMLQKMTPEEKEKYLKDKEKEDKIMKKMSPEEKEAYLKRKQKEEEMMQKMTPEEKQKYLKEKEKDEQKTKKMSPEEKEKYFKDKEKGQTSKEKGKGKGKGKEEEGREEDTEKYTPKEKGKRDKETELEKHKKEQRVSEGSITIKEVERKKEKVLIVEKGPTTTRTAPASKHRVGSIDVVTRSQFDLLAEVVGKLKESAGPLPMPSLPDNKKLRADLAKGNASLTDTMQAMQVSARVEAAERGLSRMAELLTQLAAAGALPDDLADQFDEFKDELQNLQQGSPRAKEKVVKEKESSMGRQTKSVMMDPKLSKSAKSTAVMTSRPTSAGVSVHPSVMATGASAHAARSEAMMKAITRLDMEDAVERLREDMMKNINKLTAKASVSADTAAGTANSVAEKMDVAMKLNTRISDLYALTSDYAEQLTGFDSGLTTQMTSFKEQMQQMRADLKSGLQVLETANNNAETAAVMELTERYEGLVLELETTASKQQVLVGLQLQLTEELRSLVQAVEMMREEKADRDEVLDGLRDKADSSKLAGLLSEYEFGLARDELQARLQVCYEKFNKQDHVWTCAMKDLSAIVEDKAELMQLLSVKDEAQGALRDVQAHLDQITIHLGEPKTAILTRVLSKDGRCAACRVPALMEGGEPTFGLPPALLALRPEPIGAPCEHPRFPIVTANDEKSHVCQRWVGGSHTLVAGVVREKAPGTALVPPAHTRKYDGYGVDGKVYRLEEELQPCVECNMLSKEATAEREAAGGECTCAGDAANVCPCFTK